jgi:hypothetical protein
MPGQTERGLPDGRKLILEDLDQLGSIQYTAKVLRELFYDIKRELEPLEKRCGTNWIFRLLLQALKLPQDQSENMEVRRDISVSDASTFRVLTGFRGGRTKRGSHHMT